MNRRPPTVGVVVCAYTDDRLAELYDCVGTALEQLGPGDDLVLVVDHNPALHRKARQDWPTVRVLANSGPAGLSGGRNTGVAALATDVVLFVDDDARPEPHWLEAYRSRFEDSRVVVVGGAVTPRWAGGSAPRWFPDEYGWVVGCDYRGLPPSGSAIRNPIGASMGIRRSVLTQVGGFASSLGRTSDVPAGCEETEMGIRIRRWLPDGLIVRDIGPEVLHSVPPSRQTVRYFISRCYHEGRSKAVLTAIVGRDTGLAAERAYVVQTLTTGLRRHLRQVSRGDVSGVGRAGMLVLGLAATASGYTAAGARHRRGHGVGPAGDTPAVEAVAA